MSHFFLKLILGNSRMAQINEVIPKIQEYVEMHEEGVTETDIRKNMPGRGIIVSKVIRTMLRTDSLQRTGHGKKGDAFKYHIARSLLLDGSPSYSLSYKERESFSTGLESQKQGQPPVKVEEDSCPEPRDKDGAKIENPGLTGQESEKGQKTVGTQGEMLVPSIRDKNMNGEDENRESGLAGIESGTTEWMQKV